MNNQVGFHPAILYAKWVAAILIVFFMLSAGRVQAAQPVQHLKTDSSAVGVRSFDREFLKNCRNNPEFNYSEPGGNISFTWWQRFWIWFWSLFSDIRTTVASTSASFWDYLIIILASAAVIFVVIKLRGMDIALLFSRKPGGIEVPYEEYSENIHAISFDEEIEHAVQNQDFRIAVRLLYLKALKRLSDAGRITWEPDKTNWNYVSELKHAAQKQRFTLLTREFEYVWYGSFPVDGETFKRIRNSFSEFYREAAR